MEPALEEYLRRNQLHCAAVGASANAQSALKRLLETKRPQAWLVEYLEGIISRAERVHPEMARHRDEIQHR
jgi:post-segregation antitoxin (ccd killing protein)